MQASPYAIVEGVVVGQRRVTIPARPAEQYVDRAGAEKESRPQPEETYLEVGVMCPAVLDGENGAREVHADVTALMSVRWPLSGVMVPPAGEAVRLAVEHTIVKIFRGGRFIEWVVVHYRGQAPAFVAPAAARPLAAAAPRAS